jgi:PAS domain S-box-containing protein
MAGRASYQRAVGLLATALAVALFALYLLLRPYLRGALEARGWTVLAPQPSVLELLGLAALLVFVPSAALVHSRAAHRRLLRQLRERVIALRQNPAPGALHSLKELQQEPESAALLQELDTLAGSYRTALADLVDTRSELADRGPRTPPPVAPAPSAPAGSNSRIYPNLAAHYTVTSSRHRMVARLAPKLQWVAVTPPLLQLLHRDSRDLVARSFLEVVHPDDRAGLKQTFEEAIRDGEAHNVVFRILPGKPTEAAAAAERHLQADVMTCYTEAGVPLHFRCHFIDITDRVQTENELRRRTAELSQVNAQLVQINQELQRLKESYRDLYHQAPMLFFSVDAGGRMVACNQTMVGAIGCPREKLLNHPYTQLLTPKSRAAFLADPTVFQRPGELETQWVKQDGTIMEMWIATTTIRDEKGMFIRSRSAARDITEQKRLANALKAKAAEVAQANAHLRRVNQELEDFTYVVSHDLKEPLRTLEAFSNFLAHDYAGMLGEEGNEYLRHLIQASHRLGALIDDLLTLSRSGRVIHTPRPFAWDDLLQTVLADLRDLIDRQHATVRVEAPLPSAVGDPERVIQLLSNLIANGLKYNKNPHPEIVVGSVARPATSPTGERPSGTVPTVAFVTLFVRDNGIGIDPMYHEQIFRMFRRLHRRDEVEGTGAGLAICKRIVEAHGGRIWVESQAGQGSTFFFTLPRFLVPTAPNGKLEEAVATRSSRD